MLLKILFLTLIMFIFFVIYTRIRDIKWKYKFRRISIIDWMEMSVADRCSIDNKARIRSLKRKKNLIGKTRKEYKKISNGSK